jgi:hypothetical protein
MAAKAKSKPAAKAGKAIKPPPRKTVRKKRN